MKIDVRPRKRNAPRPAEKSALGFLQYLRGRECSFAHMGGCEGKIEAMHLDFAGGKGVGTKVADKYAIPGCSKHHQRQHRIGWQSFATEMQTTLSELLRASETYWRAWPSRARWEAKHG